MGAYGYCLADPGCAMGASRVSAGRPLDGDDLHRIGPQPTGVGCGPRAQGCARPALRAKGAAYTRGTACCPLCFACRACTCATRAAVVLLGHGCIVCVVFAPGLVVCILCQDDRTGCYRIMFLFRITVYDRKVSDIWMNFTIVN